MNKDPGNEQHVSKMCMPCTCKYFQHAYAVVTCILVHLPYKQVVPVHHVCHPETSITLLRWVTHILYICTNRTWSSFLPARGHWKRPSSSYHIFSIRTNRTWSSFLPARGHWKRPSSSSCAKPPKSGLCWCVDHSSYMCISISICAFMLWCLCFGLGWYADQWYVL
jgi:hypothetical protein